MCCALGIPQSSHEGNSLILIENLEKSGSLSWNLVFTWKQVHQNLVNFQIGSYISARDANRVAELLSKYNSPIFAL